MRGGQAGDCKPQLAGQSTVWQLPGRSVVSWRTWELCSAGVFDRGEGEGVWRSDQHRLVFSPLPRPPMLLQLDGGPVTDLCQVPDAVGIYPAGILARTVVATSRYIEVALIGFRGGEASTGKQGWEALVREQKRV